MRSNHRSRFKTKILYNRLNAVLAHTNYYAFNPHSKMADQTGLTYSTIHAIGKGEHSPTLFTALKILEALETTLKRKLDIREVFSLTTEYPTITSCELIGNCKKCQFSAQGESVTAIIGLLM